MMVLELGGKGYSCGQIILAGALRYLDRENADLLRAASGLAQGMGCGGGICGALSGGLCLLGLYLGKGADAEQADPLCLPLMEELNDWFAGAAGAGGEITCDAILGLDAPDQSCAARAMDPARCGALVAAVFDRVISMLVENGVDPAEGREAS